MRDVPLLSMNNGDSFQADQSEGGSTFSRPPGLVPYQGSVLSKLFVSWVFPMLERSFVAEQLSTQDLFELTPEAKPQPLFDKFHATWQKEVTRLGLGPQLGPPSDSRRSEGRTLLWALMVLHWGSLRVLWFGRISQVLLDFSFPLFLYQLVAFIGDPSQPVWKGLLYATILFLCQGLSVLIDNNVSIGGQNLSCAIRSSMVTAIFKKVVILRQDSLLRFSTGRLNNMISTDVNKARRCVRFIHILLFTAPLRLIIGFWALWKLMGWAIVIGISWLLVVLVLNQPIMYYANKLEDKMQSFTDERVRRVTEVVSAIQVVKCYAWEGAATEKVKEGRRKELGAMWKQTLLWTCVEGLWQSVVPITTAIMFTSYSIIYPEHPLTAEQAFTAASLLSQVQDPLFGIPWVLNLIVEAKVAAQRLERLFLMPEAHLPATACIGSFCNSHPSIETEEDSRKTGSSNLAVNFQNANFMWPRAPKEDEDNEGRGSSQQTPSGTPDAQAAEDTIPRATTSGSISMGPIEFRLADINLQIPKGCLVAIVGSTASGKTSLLHALLGEMPQIPSADGGEGFAMVMRNKPLAFAPQQPWVFNGTIRQNILFGEAFAEKRYLECVRACDLEKDFSLLKLGENTKVGEKGIALSGGQKARVCLARAAYRQAASSLFLLDDPYSALDAHVAKKVHEELVCGMLKGKTRVVSTNRLEFCSSCDMVVVLDWGKIEAIGRYEDLRASSATLKALADAQGLQDVSQAEKPVDEKRETPTLPPPNALSRAVSAKSSGSEGDQADPDDEGHGHGAEDELEESREVGNISKEVMRYYLRALGGAPVGILLASNFLGAEALSLAMWFWMAQWTHEKPEGKDLQYYVRVYLIISSCYVLLSTTQSAFANLFGFRAARRLHELMFASILRAPMSFFQDTPQGRIINRFSKDTSEIDREIVWQVVATVVPVLSVLGNFAMIGAVVWISVVMFLPAFYIYYWLWKHYNKTALELKRISKVLSSPVYDHFANLCRENASTVVRAMWQVDRQCKVNNDLLAEQQRAEYSENFLEGWFQMRVEHLGCVLVFLVSTLVVLGRDHIPDWAAGLALTFAGECSGSIQSLIGQLALFSMAFNCVERVMEYATKLPAEAAPATEQCPPEHWPSHGVLVVRNLRLRYRPQLPLVLKGLTFTTSAGERLGVVGRTGAGKSSLLLALFRLTEPEPGSEVVLDGQNLLRMGLTQLRKGLAMIPQEPVLFQETLRYNCDPFNQYSAQEIWTALEEAQLASWLRDRSATPSSASSMSPMDLESASPRTPTSAELEEMLSMDIKEGGQNLSAGQRQMVAIARAVLRQSKLVVLDEATAAVDAATDAAIQLAVRRCFHGATTLTVAHRLQTILDSDRVMVLEQGEVAELDTPAELLKIEGGLFRGLVEETEKA